MKLSAKYEVPRALRLKTLLQLAQLGNQALENYAWLAARGWQRLLVAWEFDKSLCMFHDADAHCKYLIEAAKETIGSTSLRYSPLLGGGDGYQSPWLTEQRKERDARLGDKDRVINRELFEIDPARIEEARLRKHDFERWRRGDAEYRVDMLAAKSVEAKNYRGDEVLGSGQDIVFAVFEQKLRALGYVNKASRGRDIILFRGPCFNSWQLCVSISRHPLHVASRRLYVSAHIRHAQNSAKADARDYLATLPPAFHIPIRFQEACLYFGVYEAGNNNDTELLAACYAHLDLFENLHPSILNTLESALRGQ